MKNGIHPNYQKAKVVCVSCGNEFETGSDLSVIYNGKYLGRKAHTLIKDDFLLFLCGKSIAVHLAILHSHFRLICLFGAAVQSAIPPVL